MDKEKIVTIKTMLKSFKRCLAKTSDYPNTSQEYPNIKNVIKDFKNIINSSADTSLIAFTQVLLKQRYFQHLNDMVNYLREFKEYINSPEGKDRNIEDIENDVNELIASSHYYFTNTLDTVIKAFKESILTPPTFALPSHDVMFTLLALFTGNPERIPRKALEKPYQERTPEEQAQVEELIQSMFTEDSEYTDRGKENTVYALIADNARVEAKAKIDISIFNKDLIFKEGTLAGYIRRTYGAEGLKHLLGLIIGLEENGRNGTLIWNINKHLDRLGYAKDKGTHKPEAKRKATEIIKILTSLCIVAHEKKKNGKITIRGERLFSIDGFDIEMFENKVIDEHIKIRATDFWYKNAFEPPDKKAPMYTKLLKKVAGESHRDHPYTIFLTPLLTIFWRMNETQTMKVSSLLNWCNIKVTSHNFRRDLKNLLAEIRYMEDKGYIGDFEFSGGISPLDSDNPLNVSVKFYPPEWFQEEMKSIRDKKKVFYLARTKDKDNPLVTVEDIKKIMTAQSMTQSQFSNTIGMSRGLLSMILNGKRTVTLQASNKIREVFKDLLTP